MRLKPHQEIIIAGDLNPKEWIAKKTAGLYVDTAKKLSMILVCRWYDYESWISYYYSQLMLPS